VFISYVHATDMHKRQVLDFARFLESQGVETVLDRWTTVDRKEWYPWIVRQVTSADRVLAIASGPYRDVFDGPPPAGKRHGTQAEASVLRELLYTDRATWLPKILPVVLSGHDVDEIPLILQPQGADHYRVADLTVVGAENLLRVLFRKPKHVRPARGTPPPLPPRSW
jgi:hypothetical protein